MKGPVLLNAFCALILLSGISNGNGVSAQGQSHYCSRDRNVRMETITGETEGSIYTLYPGDSFYQNNQNCSWLIDAGPNNRVEITVVSSSLQWAPEAAICPGYDHVAIKDVMTRSSTTTGKEGGAESIVLQWCGHFQPLGAISSGRYVRVEFMSDKSNPYQYKGVHLKFKTFAASNCAPSWNVSRSNGTEFCYKLLDRETDWSSAQRECNTQAANLVSVVSENEHQFLLQAYESDAETAWIGLNDIEELGNYKWIDGKELTIDKFGDDHAENQYFHCVSLHFSEETWQVQECKGFSTKPLCKSNKGKRTVIFPIPQPSPNKGEDSLPIGKVPIIIICIAGVVVIIVISVCIFIVCKRPRNAYRAQKQHESDSPDRQDGSVPLQTRSGTAGQRQQPSTGQREQPSAPPPDVMVNPAVTHPDPQIIAPPAYEEALGHPVVSPPAYV